MGVHYLEQMFSPHSTAVIEANEQPGSAGVRINSNPSREKIAGTIRPETKNILADRREGMRDTRHITHALRRITGMKPPLGIQVGRHKERRHVAYRQYHVKKLFRKPKIRYH